MSATTELYSENLSPEAPLSTPPEAEVKEGFAGSLFSQDFIFALTANPRTGLQTKFSLFDLIQAASINLDALVDLLKGYSISSTVLKYLLSDAHFAGQLTCSHIDKIASAFPDIILEQESLYAKLIPTVLCDLGTKNVSVMQRIIEELELAKKLNGKQLWTLCSHLGCNNYELRASFRKNIQANKDLQKKYQAWEGLQKYSLPEQVSSLTIDFLHNLSFAAPNYKFLLSN